MRDLFANLSEAFKSAFCRGSGEVDKIREEFEKKFKLLRLRYDKKGECYINNDTHRNYCFYRSGYKSANLLPTEKVCPACGGSGKSGFGTYKIECSTCKGRKTIQIYYTPEQYEKIMGKPYSEDVLVWYRYKTQWNPSVYSKLKDWVKTYGLTIIIVQTAQPAPSADYRPGNV